VTDAKVTNHAISPARKSWLDHVIVPILRKEVFKENLNAETPSLAAKLVA
jgi:hypothetical protein